MNISAILTAMLMVIFSASCNPRDNAPGQKDGGALDRREGGTTPLAGAGARAMIKFIKHQVMDQEGTGLPASTYLLPEGWTVQDRLYWEYRDVFVPIRYAARLQNGDGTLKIEAYPDLGSTWSTGPAGTQGTRPPASVIEALKEFIKRTRKAPHLRFTAQKAIPGPGQPASSQGGMASQTWLENGIVRVEYEANSQLIEEEYYGVLSVVRVASQGVVYMETIGWSISGLGSCSAPKGRLDECRKIALTVRSSARLTLPFYNRFVQVKNLLQDQAYARIYQAGQISRIISQTNDQISQTISDSYWNAQRTNDRVNQQFSDYTRGVDRYKDGTGTEWQLPSGYANAWMNTKGEYLLSDQPGFNPNAVTGEEWQPLEKR